MTETKITLAPVVLFTYKRLEILKETVASLQRNDLALYSELFVFSDGAKSKNDEHIVYGVRSFLKTITGFKKVTIYEAETNIGLANSIIRGVSQVIKQFGKVIVLEDDLKITPNFLCYMNVCLNKYEFTKNIFSASGYSFNLGNEPKSKDDVYFLNRGWSWGWATWKDRWDLVDWSMKEYPAFVKNRGAKKAFSKGGSDLNSMLKKQMNGKIDAWDIRWFYCQSMVKGLTVYPVLSKVYNNGFDKDATHTTGSSKRYVPLIDTGGKNRFAFPTEAGLSNYYQKQFLLKMGIKSRIVSKLETMIKKVIVF